MSVTKPIKPIAFAVLAAGYPFLSTWLVDQGWGRIVLLLFAALTLRRIVLAGRPIERLTYAGAVALLMAGAFYMEAFLTRLIPALVYLSLALLFGYTLTHPPSLLERMVRLQFPEFKPGIAEYLRQLTWLWTSFFAANVLICTVLAGLADEAVWMIYTGLIVYLLMGILVLGEVFYRPRRFPDLEMPRPLDSVKVMIRDGHKVFRELRE